MTHLAKDCPDKGKKGAVAAYGPADGCKSLQKKLNEFSSTIFLVLISNAAFFCLICMASLFPLFAFL